MSNTGSAHHIACTERPAQTINYMDKAIRPGSG
jgi:hypothetical protein